MDRGSAARAPARRGIPRRAGGGVLIEFSISVLVLWLIAAATLDLGRAFAASHVLQGATRAAARELALRDAAWNATLGDVLPEIFDPDFLVVDADCLESTAQTNGITPREELTAQLTSQTPTGLTLNEMLRPLMVFERLNVNGVPRRLYRYPGALLNTGRTAGIKGCAATEFAVGVPELDTANTTVVMHPVVEEIQPGAFSFQTQNTLVPAGTAALLLHYPYQAVSLSSWRNSGGVNSLVLSGEADDFSVDMSRMDASYSTMRELDLRNADGSLQAYAMSGGTRELPIHGGRLGLGYQLSLAQEVRPYRRVIAARAIVPRELVLRAP